MSFIQEILHSVACPAFQHLYWTALPYYIALARYHRLTKSIPLLYCEKPTPEDFSDTIDLIVSEISQELLFPNVDRTTVKEILIRNIGIMSSSLDFPAFTKHASNNMPKTRGVSSLSGADQSNEVTTRDLKVVSAAWGLFINDDQQSHLCLQELEAYSANVPRVSYENSRFLKKMWLGKQLLAQAAQRQIPRCTGITCYICTIAKTSDASNDSIAGLSLTDHTSRPEQYKLVATHGKDTNSQCQRC